MKSTNKKLGLTANVIGFLGIGLCALCCAIPIFGILGGAGLLAGLAVYTEKIALVLLVASVAAFGLAVYRRKKARACDLDCECKTDNPHNENLKSINDI
ncbi:MAG TPA: hypothetical protein VG737_06690 [Cyclobacteriaceae bacterium]|nr:hypothetical protein [Cyclobacteriaceae bacterium]